MSDRVAKVRQGRSDAGSRRDDVRMVFTECCIFHPLRFATCVEPLGTSKLYLNSTPFYQHTVYPVETEGRLKGIRG